MKSIVLSLALGLGSLTVYAVSTGDVMDETFFNQFVQKAGDTMAGVLNMGNNRISGLLDGSANTDAVTVQQLNAVAAAGGYVKGGIYGGCSIASVDGACWSQQAGYAWPAYPSTSYNYPCYGGSVSCKCASGFTPVTNGAYYSSWNADGVYYHHAFWISFRCVRTI